MPEGRHNDPSETPGVEAWLRRQWYVYLVERAWIPTKSRAALLAKGTFSRLFFHRRRIGRHVGDVRYELEIPPLRWLDVLRRHVLSVAFLTAFGSAAIIIYPQYEMKAQREQEIENMRDHFKEVAQMIYFRDGNTTVAKELIEMAEGFDRQIRAMDSDLKYLSAFIDGMDVVYRLLNLDRQLTNKERNVAHRALASAETLIRIKPEAPDGYLLRGQVFMALDQLEQARKALDTAYMKADREGTPVRKALASWRIAMVIVEKALEGNSWNIREAHAARALSRLHEAVDIFSAVDARNTDDDYKTKVATKWPYMTVGNIYRDLLYDYDNSIEYHKRALKADPNFAMGYFNLGLAYLDKANEMRVSTATNLKQTVSSGSENSSDPKWKRENTYGLARKAFKQAIRANPGRREGYYGLGMLYGSQNKYPIALRYFDKAIARDKCEEASITVRATSSGQKGCYLKALKYRAISRLDMGGEYDEALADLDAAIRIQPDDAELYVYRARLYVRQQKLAQAKTDIEFATALGGAGHMLPLTEAELMLAFGRSDTAIEKAETAIKIAREDHGWPSLPEAHELMARAHLNAKRMKQAQKSLDLAVSKASYRPERFYLARGCLRLLESKESAALTDFRKALDWNGTYRPAVYARRLAMTDLEKANDDSRIILPTGVNKTSFWRLRDPYYQLCRRANATRVADVPRSSLKRH